MDHLNVSSLRKKFPLIEELMKDETDIQFLSEVKIDEIFPKPSIQNCRLQNVSQRQKTIRWKPILCFIKMRIFPVELYNCRGLFEVI